MAFRGPPATPEQARLAMAGGVAQSFCMFFYTYVLESSKDFKFYIGWTNDLKRRLEEHNNGNVISTSTRRPFKLVYFEACLNKKQAIAREKYFKSGFGRRFLKNRIVHIPR